MSNKSYLVYMHVSPSGKKYVGITSQSNPNRRWQNGKGYSYNQYFTRAIEKYTWDNFEHIIVAKGLTEEEAKWLEIELIRVNDTTNPNKGYNITKGGEGASGYHHTEEWRKKMSESHRDMSGENNPNYGKRRELAPMFGKHHSEETRKKMSEKAKGRTLSEKAKQKVSQANSGKNHPQAKSVICITTKKIFFTIKDGGEFYNIHSTSIVQCCKGKAKTCGRYNGQKLVWRYLNYKHNKTYRVKGTIKL